MFRFTFSKIILEEVTVMTFDDSCISYSVLH